MNAYYKIFADVPDTDYENAVTWLERELELELTRAYQELFEDADVRHFNDVYYGDVDHPVPGQIDHWVS